jgi:hypothetical protein
MLPVLGLVTGSLRRKGATQTNSFGLLALRDRKDIMMAQVRCEPLYNQNLSHPYCLFCFIFKT